MGHRGKIATFFISSCENEACPKSEPGNEIGQKSLYRGKNVNNMEGEQRYVIKFFTDEGMTGVDVISQILISQRKGWRSLWGLRRQRSIGI
jgi:hypothetical protein